MSGATTSGEQALTGGALAAHLQMIQAVIGRMGQNAFSTKTWAVTVMAAVLALGPALGAGARGAGVVVLPLVVFWFMDAYYMRQEHLFRRLYEAAVRGEVPAYSMDTSPQARGVVGTLAYAFASAVWPVHVITVLAVGARALMR